MKTYSYLTGLTSKMPKKKRRGYIDRQQNGEERSCERRQNVHMDSAGPSSAQNSITMEPNPDVHKIPLNKNGTFIEKILVGCAFCSQKFDRPDYYYLHHAEKHAKLYGDLPKLDSNISKNTAGSNDSPFSTERKRRRSMSTNAYINEDSSDTSESDNEITNCPNIDNEPDKSSTIDSSKIDSNNTEPKRKRKRKSSNFKQEYIKSSSSSDSDLHSLKSIFKNINKKLQLYDHKIKKLLKFKSRLVYKCKICSLHFLKKTEWLKHVNHAPNPLKCKHCKLKFSDKSLKKHEKMHMKEGQIQKILKFEIITDKSYDYSLSESDSDISLSECSESNDEMSKTDHSPKPGPSNLGVKPTTTEKYLETNNNDRILSSDLSVDNSPKPGPSKPGVEPSKTENELVTNKIVGKNISNEHGCVKKKYKAILFKCDDCEEHFPKMETWESHTNNSAHWNLEKKTTQCNVCTIKFSCSQTLQKHKDEHHSNGVNLSKEDFLIITNFNKKLPEVIKLMNSINKANKNKYVNRFISNQKTERTGSVDNQSKIAMYKCEGCNLFFMNRSTWTSHLYQPRCYKNKLNFTDIKECPTCKVFFTNRIWTDHMIIHTDNPSITKNSFEIHSRKPKRYSDDVTVPQSDVVSTTGKDLDSNVKYSASDVDQDFSSNQNQGTGKNTSNDKSCKVVLTKSTEGVDKWQVMSKRSEDVLNTNTIELSNDKNTTIANISKNNNQNPENSQIYNKESHLIEPKFIDNNTANVLNDLNTTTFNQASDANINSMRNNDQIVSLADVRSQSFEENIMEGILSTGNANKNGQCESKKNIITTADTTTEGCDTHTSYQEINQNETQVKSGSTYARSEIIAVDQGVKNKENIETGSNDLRQSMSQIKNETYIDKIDIKTESEVAENETAVQNKEIKAENVIVKDKQEIKSENNEELTNSSKNETNDVEPENNAPSDRIKISNFYSERLKVENPSQSCFFKSENNTNNVDSPKMMLNTMQKNVKEYDFGESSINRNVDKIQQREIENIDSDDSQATVILESFDGIKYDPTFDCNDATLNTISSDYKEINNVLQQQQNVTDQKFNEPSNDVNLSEDNVSVPTNDTTKQTVTSNENTIHFTVRQEGVPSTSISVNDGRTGFRVRDRSKANHSDDDIIVDFNSTRIKNEEAEEIRARNRRSNRETRQAGDDQQEIINLANESDENDDVIMEPQIVATIDITDDDD